MAKPWNVAIFGSYGFLIGVIFAETELLLHPGAVLARTPIAAAILAGFMMALAAGGAAISHNRFGRSMDNLIP